MTKDRNTKDWKKDGNFVRQLIWVIIIFAAAAMFRVTNLDLIEFKLDEARDVYEMERLFEDPYLPERGTIQSTGVYNPPLWYYILAVLSLPSRDPQYLSFMIGLINSAAVAGFYLVARRFFGQWVGLVAALLLATSPWSILFSRKIWAPEIILPFTVVWFWCMNGIFSRQRVLSLDSPTAIPPGNNSGAPSVGLPVFVPPVAWSYFGLFLALGLLAQIHASGLFLMVGTGAALLIFHLSSVFLHSRSVDLKHSGSVFTTLKYAFMGLIISLVPLLPYINYQIKTGCEDCRAFTSYQEGETIVKKSFDANAFLRPFQFITGSGFQVALGSEGYQAYVEQNPIIRFFEFVFLLEFLLLLLGVFYIFKHKREFLWMVIVLAVVPFLYFATQTPAHLYYFLILAPVIVTISAFGIIHLGSALAHPRGAKAHPGGAYTLSITLVSLITLINLVFTFSFYKFLGDIKVVPGDYGATFGVVKEQAHDAGMKVEEYIIRMYQREY